MEKRMHPSTVKFSRTLAVGNNLSCRRIIDLGNHSVKDDVHTSNSLQDIIQNHWTMKYRSQRPTFILMSNVGSY